MSFIKPFFFMLLSGVGVTNMTAAPNKLITYSAPDGVELKTDFTVQVREPGKEWKYTYGKIYPLSYGITPQMSGNTGVILIK